MPISKAILYHTNTMRSSQQSSIDLCPSRIISRTHNKAKVVNYKYCLVPFEGRTGIYSMDLMITPKSTVGLRPTYLNNAFFDGPKKSVIQGSGVNAYMYYLIRYIPLGG